MAMELPSEDIDALFAMKGDISLGVDLDGGRIHATSSDPSQKDLDFSFSLNSYDRSLVSAGGWLTFADTNY